MNKQTKNRSIYFFPAVPNLIRKKRKGILSQGYCSWIYLGKNSITHGEISEILDKYCDHIDTGDKLQDIAKSNRQVYIDYVGQINTNKDNQWWWLTSLSEKNPFISDAFLHICYLILTLDHVQTRSDNLIVISEFPFILRSIADNLKQMHNLNIFIENKMHIELFSTIQRIMGIIFDHTAFIFICLYKIFLSRLFAHYMQQKSIVNNTDKRVIIHSFTDQRSFTALNEYNHIYFGSLGNELIKKGFFPLYLIHILPKMSYYQGIKKIKVLSDNFILFEEFITITDVIKSLKVQLYRDIENSVVSRFNGLNVNGIILSQIALDKFNSRAKYAYLVYCASMRLCKTIDFSTFIYIFENHIWEKMVCLGIKNSSSNIFMSGYAHSIVNTMYTSYSLSNYEADSIPLPDRIIVNGKRAKEVLTSSGFTNRDIVIGGALRYKGYPRCEKNQDRNNADIRILVTPSPDYLKTIEFLNKVFLAFHRESSLKVIIKPHPLMRFNRVRKHLPDFPNHFSIIEQSVEILLNNVDLLIFTDSTVSIEALARGIPVLQIKSDFTIDINPLEDYDCVPSASKPQELLIIAKELISQRNENIQRYKEIALDFFEPVHEDIVGIFLGDNYTAK